jgi:hypothetical protein
MLREYKGVQHNVADDLSEEEWKMITDAIDEYELMREPTQEEIDANQEFIRNLSAPLPSWPGAVRVIKAK